MKEGNDWRTLAATLLPGGSFGNGAAMRVAPVGLVFADLPDELWEQARLSALPTHTHLLGIEGAQLLAFAVAWALRTSTFDRKQLWRDLLALRNDGRVPLAPRRRREVKAERFARVAG